VNYLSANELSETLTGMIVFIASSFFKMCPLLQGKRKDKLIISTQIPSMFGF